MTVSDIIGIALISIGVFCALVLIYYAFVSFRLGDDAHGPSVTPTTMPDEEYSKRAISLKGRLAGLGVGAAAVFSALFFKLWSMQVISSEDYVELADKNKTREIPTKAPRGRILDRNGEVLVGNRASLVVVAEKDVLKDTLLIRRLANVLGMPAAAVRRHIQDESQGAAAPRVVAMDVPMTTVSYIVEHPVQFPKISIESRSVRSYPHGPLAAHIIGYTGTVSKEDLEKNKADVEAGKARIEYSQGDVVGKTGLEAQYEDVLQGVTGTHTVQVDAHGKVTKFVEDVPAVPGSDIQLTLDIKIQEATERYLKEAIRIARRIGSRGAHAGAAVVMDVNTGGIVAMASYPTYDPSMFIGGIGAGAWEALMAEDAHNPLSNRAIAGLYPMASTIKSFSAISALEYGIAQPDSSYMCNGKWKGFGEEWFKWCWKHSGHGPQNLVTGIINSCDTVFYEIGKAFAESSEPEGLQATYGEWGLGEKSGIDLPGEAKGRIPTAKWKEEHFKNLPESDRRWVHGDTVNMVIGQGDVLVTPLQVVNSYCAIANGGTLLRPHVLDKVLAQDSPQNLIEHKTESIRKMSVDQEHLDLVIRGLRGVVSQGSVRKYYQSMKTAVAGKTGTAQVANKGDYAWFVGYAPFESPQYAVALLVEQGGGGGTVAAPAVRQIFGAIFDEPMPEITVEVDNTR